MQTQTTPDTELHAQFLKVHLSHQRGLFAYLIGAVRDFQVAEDLLQNISLVLWRKFTEFDPARPYLAWAFGFARIEVARYRREQGRRGSGVAIDIANTIADTLVEHQNVLRQDRHALLSCVKKLPPMQQKLVHLRYQDEVPLREIGSRVGKSLHAVNMILVRIRQALLDCTRRANTEEL